MPLLGYPCAQDRLVKVTTPTDIKFACNHSAILNLSLRCPDQGMATKCPQSWSPGLILGPSYTVFRACPVGADLWAKFVRTMTESGRNLHYEFCFLA